jgi:leukotriene-A4 hydrolase
MKKIIFYSILAFFAFSCKTKTTSIVNNHSYSNYEQVQVKHLSWNATINFEKKIIEAIAQWSFTNKTNAKEIILDTKNLTVSKVENSKGESIAFSLDTTDHEYLGSSLKITIASTDTVVSIYYSTSPNAKALQWLTPQQTADKKMPYLFTQCEAIAARSVIPCQDAPAVRITYNANLTVPKGMMAVMSAENPQQKNEEGKYSFNMPIPIPSYLIALSVGDISFAAIDERSGVYAEPSVLAKARKELEDIPQMIAAAEKIAGPYIWKRYDVMVQPPSFPIGGMENPKLTFATPTILAGDKSLVSLIAHELAHSWSGNTVTNSSWNDLWLNEGFTTYFERRIMENLTDTTYNDMLWELSYQDMMQDLEDTAMPQEFKSLRIELKGRDPEDAFSNIPYEKGAHLLWLIEKTVGRKAFDDMMNSYFTENRFKPMDTKTALAFIDKKLSAAKKDWKEVVGIDEWVYQPGLPKNCPRPGQTRFAAIAKIQEDFNLHYLKMDQWNTKSWTTHEWLQLLRHLPSNMPLQDYAAMDKKFNLTNTTNSEIAFEWYMHSLADNYKVAYPNIEQFLLRVGRKKFVKPLYKKMLDTGKKEMAESIFAKAKDNYHPATKAAVEEILAPASK